MSDLSTYAIWAVILIVLALADRFILRRGRCELTEVHGAGFSDGFYRVGIRFNAYLPLIFSQVSHTLRDVNHPTTVIAGKTRSLEFSKRGSNHEYLIIKSDLLSDGDWVIDVKIESIGCRINPLYQIFPLTSHRQQKVTITKEVPANEVR